MTALPALLDYRRLTERASELRAIYASASPFPHVVMDDFLPVGLADRILFEFPAVDAIDWKNKTGANSRKLASRDVRQLGSVLQTFLQELNAAPFRSVLATLTGIPDLQPDPEFEGGGIHQIERGGFLNVHADFNFHPRLQMDRRLNLLIYLNKDWLEDYGGHLELWTPDMSECAKRVLPVFNRCVVFSTTDTSFHGHPNPLACPEGRTRKSVAIYYYTAGRPDAEKTAPHDTIYKPTRSGIALSR